MIYKVKHRVLDVPVEQVHAGLTVYDTWIRGLGDRRISKEERIAKVEAIAALLAPRQRADGDRIVYDYYAPERLWRVLLSEIGKRAKGRIPKREPMLFRV